MLNFLLKVQRAQMRRKKENEKEVLHKQNHQTLVHKWKYIVFNPATRYCAAQTYSTIARNQLKIKLHSYIYIYNKYMLYINEHCCQQAVTQQA